MLLFDGLHELILPFLDNDLPIYTQEMYKDLKVLPVLVDELVQQCQLSRPYALRRMT